MRTSILPLLLLPALTLTACELGVVDPGDDPSCPELTAVAGEVVVDGCRVVDAGLTVDGDSSLVLEAGSTLRFGDGAWLDVRGMLRSLGTEAEPVLLTGRLPAPGHWNGVDVSNGVVDLAWTTVEYAGGGEQSALHGDGQVALAHVTVRDNLGYGVTLGSGTSLTAFEANTFEDNADGALYLEAELCGHLDAGSTYGGPITVNGTVTGSAEWVSGLTYRVDGWVEVEGTLTLGPDTRLVFDLDGQFNVLDGGSLQAVGTADAPVAFTAETAARGSWRGLVLGRNPATPHRLSHVVVEYGGDGNGGEDVNLHVLDGSALHMDHTLIRESAGFGLILEERLTGSVLTANVLTGNALGPAKVSADSVALLDAGSSYTGNDEDVVEVTFATLVEDATWRYLGPVTHYVPDQFSVESHLTLEPGMVFSFGAGGRLSVETMSDTVGRLTAVGTAEAPIVFTGAVQSAGYWEGLSFYDATLENRLEHVVVEYAGAGEAAIATHTTTATNPTRLTLTDVVLREVTGCGIDYDYGDTAISLTGVTYEGVETQACNVQ